MGRSVLPTIRNRILTCYAFLLLGPISGVLAAPKKVLCLHGGDNSANAMREQVRDIKNALPDADYEFVYAQLSSDVSEDETWWSDPSGGIGAKTSSENQASAFFSKMDSYVTNDGPFFGIMGYSQGAAAVAVYLAYLDGLGDGRALQTFPGFAMMFCGYLTTTHRGLLARVNRESPFGGIRALVWLSWWDYIISNEMTTDLAGKFSEPVMLCDGESGHLPPPSDDPTFQDVVNFLTEVHADSSRTGGVNGPAARNTNPTYTFGSNNPTCPWQPNWLALFISLFIISILGCCTCCYGRRCYRYADKRGWCERCNKTCCKYKCCRKMWAPKKEDWGEGREAQSAAGDPGESDVQNPNATANPDEQLVEVVGMVGTGQGSVGKESVGEEGHTVDGERLRG